MEEIEENWQEEQLKSHTAIRCAKAAFLLSALKNANKYSTAYLPQFQDEEKIEMLKMELVKEKQKLKNSRLWIGVLLLHYMLVLLLIYPFLINSP